MGTPFYKWTGRDIVDYFRGLDRKKRIRLAAFGGGGAVFLVLIFWPAWVARLGVEARVRELRNGIDFAQSQIRLEPTLGEQKKQYVKFIEETRSELLTEEETQGLIGVLTELAEKSKASLLSTQPQTDTPSLPAPFAGQYMPLSYLLVVEGGYHALATFVSEIENHPKILRVDEFSVTPREESPGVHVSEIRLSAFLVKEGGETHVKTIR